MAEAIGYSHQMKSLLFKVTLATIEAILQVFKPVNSMLQIKELALTAALPLLNHSVEQIRLMRADDTFSNI